MKSTPIKHTIPISMASAMTSQAAPPSASPSPASDYLTVKSLISRHANNKGSPKPPKPLPPSPLITPRTRRKIQEQIQDLPPRDQMAFCRADDDVRTCGNLQDLLDNFHQAFSEDQLWAIVFQFMTLYRNAIVLRGGGGARASSSASTSSRLDDSSSSSKSSSAAAASLGHRHRKIKSALVQKKKKKNIKVALNRSSEGGSSGGGSASDSEGSSSSTSDVEASDNSDIISELMLGESGNCVRAKKNGWSGGAAEVGNATPSNTKNDDTCGSSDEGGGDDRLMMLINDNEKPKSRLDHVDYLFVPTSLRNFHIHKDGSVHVSYVEEEPSAMRAASQKQILMKLGLIFYRTMDSNLLSDEECFMSPQMEELMCLMISEDDYDEGIEGDLDTKEMDHILQICHNRIKTYCPESHYKAVCRALVAEVGDLKLFLQKISDGETEQMRLSVDAQASKQELDQLYLNDWACFWVQVLDELRSGIRLKKSNYMRAPVEYEMTPYEMLMDDIRSKNYRLRKVLVNGEIPQRVKNDAHAIILEFIRSRPPLKKASERKLAPKVTGTVCPMEALLSSIRRGKELRSIQKSSQVRPGERSSSAGSGASRMPPAREAVVAEERVTMSEPPIDAIFETRGVVESQPITTARMPGDGSDSCNLMNSATEAAAAVGSGNNAIVTGLPPSGTLKRNKQRRIEVDYSLLHDDETFSSQASTSRATVAADSRKVVTKENDQNVHNVPLRRPTDLGTVPVAREEIPNRRHTIVGCHQDDDEDDVDLVGDDDDADDMEAAARALDSVDGPSSYSMGPPPAPQPPAKVVDQQKEEETDDRLSLTLEEIVHIRSVMTKAELEGLPIEVRIKEDVEKRKVCFLCLKTRFSIFGQWGVQCKLCQKTVCAKCYTKMRIPTEHFGNVPVILLSPSLLNSPSNSGTSSPCHLATAAASVQQHNNNYQHYHTMNEMDAFPKTLMERLMRPETDMKKRWAVGSAPASPRHHHISTTSTPGIGISEQMASMSLYQAPEPPAMLSSCAKDRAVASIMSRSMEGPRSLPLQSPARPHSVTNTLERRSRFAFMSTEQKESLRGELMAVCNDCRGLVLEIIRSSRQQTRSSARNRAIKKLTLDLEPFYKPC